MKTPGPAGRRHLGWLLVILFALTAQLSPAAIIEIPFPNAAYLSATARIDIDPFLIPDFSLVSTLTDGTQTLTFIDPNSPFPPPSNLCFFCTAQTAGVTWVNPWGTPGVDPVEDATPRVIYSGGLDELDIDLSFPTPVFGFEAEPFSLNPSLFGKDEFEIRVEFRSPSGKEGEIRKEWDGTKQSADLFAALSLGDPFTEVRIRAKGLPEDLFGFGIGGFGMANFRYWNLPVPPAGPSLQPIPEPATTWLLFSGLGLLVGLRRTRQALGGLVLRAGRKTE